MPGKFRFIDLPTAAEQLGVKRHELLAMVEQGKIKPFSGSGQQAIFRSADVDRLASDLPAAAGADAVTEPVLVAGAETPGRRIRKRDPVKLVGTRLSMDSRWAEITESDLAAWIDAVERQQYERIKTVAGLAIDHLNRVLELLEQSDQAPRPRGANPGTH